MLPNYDAVPVRHMAPSLDGPGAGPPQALGPFLWLMEFRLLVGCQGIPEMM
jgi:hypothetical protein